MKLYAPLLVRIGFIASASIFILSGCDRSENAAGANRVDPDSQQGVVDNSNSMRNIELAKKIDRAIGDDQSLAKHAIGVLAIDGVVRLTGKVSTSEEHDRLVNIVREIEGVNSIDDHITIDNDHDHDYE